MIVCNLDRPVRIDLRVLKGFRAPGLWPLKSRAPGLQATINRALGLKKFKKMDSSLKYYGSKQ